MTLLGLGLARANAPWAGAVVDGTPTTTPATTFARPTLEPPAATPAPVTRDFAPTRAQVDKSEMLIVFPDGHYETWLIMPGSGLEPLRRQLPAGAEIVAVAAPASLMGKQAPQSPTTRAVRSVTSQDPGSRLPTVPAPLTTPVVGR